MGICLGKDIRKAVIVTFIALACATTPVMESVIGNFALTRTSRILCFHKKRFSEIQMQTKGRENHQIINRYMYIYIKKSLEME